MTGEMEVKDHNIVFHFQTTFKSLGCRDGLGYNRGQTIFQQLPKAGPNKIMVVDQDDPRKLN